MSVAFNSDVDLTVEIAFDTDPFATSQTFTDVSAYIREFSIDRGRQHDLADYQTGTASVLLNNADDRFNPLNTSSPYYDSSTGATKISPFNKSRSLVLMMEQQQCYFVDLYRVIQNHLVDKVLTLVFGLTVLMPLRFLI
jgi:hypothetical protein